MCQALAWCGHRRQAHTASKAARVCGVMRLSRGAMAHRGQAPWHVVPSVMQRKQPISLLRSLSASIDHRVCVAGSRVVVIGDRPTASKAARVWRRAFEPWSIDSRGQAPWHVLPSVMQREQPISLMRSLSTSIKHRVCGRLAWWWSSATGPQRAQGCSRVARRAFEPWGNDSPWAGALARAAECHAA